MNTTPAPMPALNGLETLCLCATAVSAHTQGKSSVNWQQMMASIAFSKLAITATSVLRLLPGSRFCSEVYGVHLWDLGAIGMLSRNLAETALTMHYLLEAHVSVNERQLRREVWEYHNYFERLKMMRTANPESEKVDVLKQEVDRRRIAIVNNPNFQKLSKDLRHRILVGEKAKLKSNEEICESADISLKFYSAMFRYGSNHTHSSPFAFSLMDRLSPQAGIGFDAVNLALTIAAGFLSVGIRGYLNIFPEQVSRLTKDEVLQLSLWLATVQWENNVHFPKLST